MDFLCVRTYVDMLIPAMRKPYNEQNKFMILLFGLITDQFISIKNEGVLDNDVQITDTVSSNLRHSKVPVHGKLKDAAKRKEILELAPDYFSDAVLPYVSPDMFEEVIRNIMDLINHDNGENGDKPISKTMKARFAKLAKEETIARFLAEVFLYTLKRKNTYANKTKSSKDPFENTSDFPFLHLNRCPHDTFFADHNNDLTKIGNTFETMRKKSAKSRRIIVLHGLSGTGKATTAWEYAHEFYKLGAVNRYNICYPINGISKEDTEDSAKAFLDAIKAPIPTGSRKSVRDRFCEWFDQPDNKNRWLLVFRSASTKSYEEYIRYYLPHPDTDGDIIITTQDTGLAHLLKCKSIEIKPFNLNSAVDFLFECAGMSPNEHDVRYAELIAEKFGCIQRKLRDAGMWVYNNKNEGFEGYLKKLEKEKTAALD